LRVCLCSYVHAGLLDKYPTRPFREAPCPALSATAILAPGRAAVGFGFGASRTGEASSRSLPLGIAGSHQPGTWTIRQYTGSGTYSYEVIGIADDYNTGDGERIFSFAQAQRRALEKAREGRPLHRR